MFPFFLIYFIILSSSNTFTIDKTSWETNKILVNSSYIGNNYLSITLAAWCYTDTKLYLFGGQIPTSSYYNIVHIIDAQTETITTQPWSNFENSTPNQLIAEPHQTACKQGSNMKFLTFNTNIYSQTTPDKKFYGEISSEKKFVNRLIMGSAQVDNFCAYQYNNTVYLTGGTNINGWPNNYATLPLDNTTTSETPGTISGNQPQIYDHGCVNYKDTNVYIFGGKKDNGVVNVYKCTINYDSCTELQNTHAPNAGQQPTTIVVDDLIFVISGLFTEVIGGFEVGWEQLIRIFDPSIDNWISGWDTFNGGNGWTRNPLPMIEKRSKSIAAYFSELKKLIIVGNGLQINSIPEIHRFSYLYTDTPTNVPSKIPSNVPTFSTDVPSMIPTVTGATLYPSKIPTMVSGYPTKVPTLNPSKYPTYIPSMMPTVIPSKYPSGIPSVYPSEMSSMVTTGLVGTQCVGKDCSATVLKDSELIVILGSVLGSLLVIISLIFLIICCIKMKNNKEQSSRKDILNNEIINSQVDLLNSNNNNNHNIANPGSNKTDIELAAGEGQMNKDNIILVPPVVPPVPSYATTPGGPNINTNDDIGENNENENDFNNEYNIDNNNDNINIGLNEDDAVYLAENINLAENAKFENKKELTGNNKNLLKYDNEMFKSQLNSIRKDDEEIMGDMVDEIEQDNNDHKLAASFQTKGGDDGIL